MSTHQEHQESNQTHERQAAGPPAECLWCPLCSGMANLRQARPEVMEHLLKAGAELLAAVRALAEAGDGRARAGGHAGDGRLKRIDVG